MAESFTMGSALGRKEFWAWESGMTRVNRNKIRVEEEDEEEEAIGKKRNQKMLWTVPLVLY